MPTLAEKRENWSNAINHLKNFITNSESYIEQIEKRNAELESVAKSPAIKKATLDAALKEVSDLKTIIEKLQKDNTALKNTVAALAKGE